MDEGIQQEKKNLRQTLLARTHALPEKYAARSDRDIQARVLSLDVWKQAKTVFVYVSMGREPDTRGLLRAALDTGKTLAVPLTFAGGVMEARVIQTFDALHPGRLGIPEPDAAAPLLPPNAIELIVVPCVAADRRGYRLGHGGGYYDRFLAQTACATVCLCRERLLLDALPHDAHDVSADWVVTERRCIGGRLESTDISKNGCLL